MKHVEKFLLKKIKEKKCIHLSLIDPEEIKPEKAALRTNLLEKYGTTAIMVGGSTVSSTTMIDDVIKKIKETTNIPVILFPNNITSISKFADAIWFMSLLNSNNPLFITGLQALAAPTIKHFNMETISLGYIIIGNETTVSYVGQAHAIPYEKAEIATCYALAGEYLGMHFIYLEAGSGARYPILSKMVSMVKKNINIPLIVGGGITDDQKAKTLIKAGANALVTCTIIENDRSDQRIKKIIHSINNIGNN